jgi:hypothetical protein
VDAPRREVDQVADALATAVAALAVLAEPKDVAVKFREAVGGMSLVATPGDEVRADVLRLIAMHLDEFLA